MKKYLNLFWAILATIIIFNELKTNQINSITILGKEFKFWFLAFVWLIIGVKNYYYFIQKLLKINQK